MTTAQTLPDLPLAEWEATKDTLHLYAQIVGKVRLKLAPRRNHWWHVPLYVTPTGWTTTAIPYEDFNFSMDFDFFDHALKIVTSRGQRRQIALEDGLTVATFYHAVMAALAELGIEVSIVALPFDHKSTTPFAGDEINSSYDRDAVERYHRMLVWVDNQLKIFAADFLGKSSPVHLFWHSFDLALTRFNGEAAPPLPQADPVTQDAYSHEVISFGFWAGDRVNRFPAFYSYTYPEPDGLTDQPLQPDAAFWQTSERGSLALLKYDDVRTLDDPSAAVQAFLQSSYDAGCHSAGWPQDALHYAP